MSGAARSAPPVLDVQGIAKTFGVNGEERTVLPGVSLTLEEGEFLALLGPSGCGKSTLIDILAGFTRPDAGRVLLRGREPDGPGPDRAVVFQEDALFPWLTARENITLGLRARKMPRAARRELAARLLARVGLAGREESLPRELSGGMRQRLALARVLALEPAVLLMDEPFAGLDAITREQMQDFLLELRAEQRMTVLLVTHDVSEAMKLADTLMVLGRDGRGILERFRPACPAPRDPAAPDLGEMRERIRDLLRGE